MPKQVLIIEDEDSVAKAIGEVCAGLGEVEVAHAKNGPAALDTFKAAAFDLVLLDILLPGGMDGYKVATAIRDAGSQVAIVVLSGFVKDPKVQKDLQAKYGVRAVLQKPLSADDLRGAIAPLLGVSASRPVTAAPAPAASAPAKVGPFQLELSTLPTPALFGELFRAKAEGVLDLTRGGVRKRFYLQRGFFRYATSNVKAETVAGLAQAKGVAESKISGALKKAKDEGIAFTDALVQLRVVSERDVAALLVAQTEEVAITALTWPDGQATFKAAPVDSGPEARANPAHCVLRGLKRLVEPAQARAALEAQKSAILERTPEFERELFSIRNLFAGETITPAVNGRSTVGELLGRAKEQDVQLLYALVESGLAHVKGVPPLALGAAPSARPTTEPGTPAFVPRPQSGVRKKHTAEEEAARAQIFGEHKRIQGAGTHYQVLGVPATADAETIKAAYLRMARTFHADAFAGLDLGDAAPVLEEIFKRAAEAHRVLGSKEERATYDHVLAAKAKGLPTNVDEIMQAEATFARAESAERAGRLRDAEKLYREAVNLNAGEPGYLLGLANAVHRLKGKAGAAEVLDLLDKALALKHDAMPALLLRGQLLLEAGDAKQALELARKLMELQAGYPGAMELLRQAKAAVNARPQTEKGGGLFGKLLGGKGK